LQIIILSISALGFWGATSLSIKEWGVAGACPNIGVPACYLVAIAYLLILVSCINHSKKLYRRLFYGGVGVVMGLAMGGSIMQATGMGACPQTGTGFPMCYISLMMSASIALAFIFKEKFSSRVVE
jgi:hypothetical protein